MGIYFSTLKNVGKSPAKDIIWYIEISKSTIDQYEISVDPAIDVLDNSTTESIRLNVPLLNPSEQIDVSILAMSTSSLALVEKPDISVRGIGIIGKEETTSSTYNFFSVETIMIIVIAVVTATSVLSKMGTSFVLNFLGLKKLQIGEGFNPSTLGQSGTFAYLFGIQNASAFEEYYHEHTELQYWKESDRLGNLVPSLTEEDIKKVIFTLENTHTLGNISQDSKGIIYYNIAKIYAHLNNFDKVKENIVQAKKYCKSLIEKRLELDPVFKNVPNEYIE